jgi:hypothetical protein
LQKLWHRVEVIQTRKEREPNNIFPGTDALETNFTAQNMKLKREMSASALLSFIKEQP